MLPLLFADVAPSATPPDVVAVAPSADSSSSSMASSRAPWMGRVGLGVGTVASSAQQKLLDADGGYGGVRWWLSGDAMWLPAPWLGVGGWAAASLRRARPDHGGPTLTELDGFVGPAVSLRSVSRGGTFLATGRLAYAIGSMGMHGLGGVVTALGYGAEIGYVLPVDKLPLGVSLGWLDAPTSPSADGARGDTLGGFYLWLTGTFR
jgi:hypothetical protein